MYMYMYIYSTANMNIILCDLTRSVDLECGSARKGVAVNFNEIYEYGRIRKQLESMTRYRKVTL